MSQSKEEEEEIDIETSVPGMLRDLRAKLSSGQVGGKISNRIIIVKAVN